MPGKEARIIIMTGGGRVGWGKKERERKEGRDTESAKGAIFNIYNNKDLKGLI